MPDLFKFTEDGELVPVGDVTVLRDEDTAIAVDDLSNKILLLFGENASGLMRAKAMRAARNLRLRSGRRHELIEVDPSERERWLKSIADSLSKGQPIQVISSPSPTTSAQSSPFLQSSVESAQVTESVELEAPHEPLSRETSETVEGLPTPPTVETGKIESREPLELGEIEPEDLEYVASIFGAYLLGLPVPRIKRVLNFRIDPRLRSHLLDYIRERAVDFFESF